MREILVTGGAGFIGAHLAARLAAEGARVFVADSLSGGEPANVPSEAELIRIDLAEPGQYERLAALRPVAVFHLAGQSSGEISFENPTRDLDVNGRATLLLADWALKQGCSRFLFASSVAVYGDSGPNERLGESRLPEPLSFYGCSKLLSERYLAVLGRSRGMRSTSFRLFNVYGPGQNLGNLKQGMVSIYLAHLLKQGRISVKGSLDRERDFIYVSDVVDLFVRSLNDERSFGGGFNLGTGVATTVRDLARLLCRAAGKPDAPIDVLPGTPGDAFRSVADLSHVNATLGWAPKVRLEDGLRRMVAPYLS